MKRAFSLLLALVMVLTLFPVTALALEDAEPNDSIPTAQEFTICDTLSGSIAENADCDWYKFTLDASGCVSLKMTSYMSHYSIWVYDEDAVSLWSQYGKEWNASVGMRTDSYIMHLTEGTYYIKVSAEYRNHASLVAYSSGNYTLKTDFENANATETEDNDSIAQAGTLSLPGSVNGQIALNDQYDFYRVDLPASGMLSLDMTSHMSYYSIYVFDSDGNELWQKFGQKWDASTAVRYDSYIMHLAEGTYYIKVSAEYRNHASLLKHSSGNYCLNVGYTDACASETEPNNSIAEAQWIAPNKPINGQIALNDRHDFFTFTLTRDMELTVDMTSYMSYYSIWLFDENSTEIWQDYGNAWDTDAAKRHDVYTIPLAAGTYFLKISAEYRNHASLVTHSSGNYTFKLNTENPFADVPADSFYYDPVLWAVEQGITTGATATTFNPDGQCLRAQVVTFLWRANGYPESTKSDNPFTDVQEPDFFYYPVLWAVENGITNGTSTTTFGSYNVCNRAAVVTFLWRAAGEPEPKTTYNPFVDVKNGDFFYKAVLWAVENGITNGIDATHFGPTIECNRAQVVTFLYRVYN